MAKRDKARGRHMIAPFWTVLGERPVGFTLVTAGGSEPVGFIGLSMAHISEEPPLLSVALDRRNKALAPIRHAGSLAVNFLSNKQRAVARSFLKNGAASTERFRNGDWGALVTDHQC